MFREIVGCRLAVRPDEELQPVVLLGGAVHRAVWSSVGDHAVGEAVQALHEAQSGRGRLREGSQAAKHHNVLSFENSTETYRRWRQPHLISTSELKYCRFF